MKTIIVALSLLLLMSAKLFSQNVWWEITFDDANNLNRVSIDTSIQNNIWQVGVPQKMLFNSSFSFPKALMTDTLNSYPTNSVCSFYIGAGYYSWQTGPYFTFYYKIDCDSINDFGILEYSTDNSISFSNIRPYLSVLDSNSNLINIDNDTIVFTGRSRGWYFATCALPLNLPHSSDSLIFKFTFHSDSIQNNHEGWMIDNVDYQISTSIEDKMSRIEMFPNPTNQSLTIITQDIVKKIVIENVAGKIVKEIIKTNPPIFLNIEDLPSGIYFVKLFSEHDNFVTTKKLIKR